MPSRPSDSSRRCPHPASYPYWLIDEFQDTTPAQYRLVRFLAGDEFKNVFAVADDDQIIYQWAGASYRQIAAFRQHFSPDVQLVENRRCPPEIVQAANNLVAHNAERTPGQALSFPLCPTLVAPLACACFPQTQTRQRPSPGRDCREGAAVWDRPRSLPGPEPCFSRSWILPQCRSNGFHLDPPRSLYLSRFAWLQSCLDQSLRPADRQVFTVMAGAANRIAGTELDAAFFCRSGVFWSRLS